MEVFRGFDVRYPNYGSPSPDRIWVTNSIFYATRFAERQKGQVVRFDVDPKLLEKKSNKREFTYEIDGHKAYGWCLKDPSILQNPEIIMYFNTL